MYPDTIKEHDKYSPIIDFLVNSIPIFDIELTELSVNLPLDNSSPIFKLYPKDHSCLDKLKFIYCQSSSQELFNLRQLFCEIQNLHSRQKHVFSMLGTHLKPMPI